MTDLRCLSLHQPWASLVAVGVKTIETRSWPTKHRGRIGIASTQRKPTPGVIGEYEVYAADPPGKVHPNHDGERPARLYRNTGRFHVQGSWCALPLGAIVATANLVDCIPITYGEPKPNDAVLAEERLISVDRDGVLRDWHRSNLAGYPGWYGEGDKTTNGQIPYGDFTPGRWAWLLDDVKPTTERCPACWGDGGFRIDEGHGNRSEWTCDACSGKGVCDPVPVKGHQRLWRWAA